MIFCYIRLVSWYKNFCTKFVPKCDEKDEKRQKNYLILLIYQSYDIPGITSDGIALDDDLC